MPPRRPILALIASVACLAAGVPAAFGLPPLSLFELPGGEGRGAVRALCPTGDGRVWVGSDRLFLFDGEGFAPVPLPAGNSIQGIALDERGQPWIVGPGIIGRLERDPVGEWHLHSLARELEAAGVSILDDNWRLGLTAQGMTLATDRRILRWEGDRFRTWELSSGLRLAPSWTGGALWFYQHGAGVLRLEAGGPRVAVAMADLPAAPVVWVLARPSGELRALGTNDGVFRRDGKKWVRLTEFSRAIAGKQPTGAVELAGDRIAIGTYLGGVVIGSLSGELESVVDRTSGLPNDYNFALCVDRDGNLWAGLQGVLARVGAQGATQVIAQGQGLQELPVARVLTHGDLTYALTSKILYELGAGRTAPMVRSADFPGYLWDAASVGDNLFVGGYGGIWRTSRAGIAWAHVLDEPADVYCLAASAHLPGGLLFVDGHAVKALVPEGTQGWTVRDLGADVVNLPLSETEIGRDIWVSTQAFGISHLRWQDAPQPALQLVRYFRLGLDLPDGLTHATLTQISGRLFALSPEGIWEHETESDRFERVPALRGYSGVAAADADRAGAAWWIVKRREVGAAMLPALARVSGVGSSMGLAVEFLEVPGLGGAGQVSTIQVTGPGNDPTLWIGGSRALLRVDPRRLQPVAAPEPTLMRRVEKNGSLLAPLAPQAQVAFDSDTERLLFEFSSANASGHGAAAYQTRLSPVDSVWSVPQRDTRRSFTGLAAGEYVFEARTVDLLGRLGPPAAYPFVLLAPWFRRTGTIVAAIVAVLVLALVVTQARRRARRRQTERLNRLVAERTRELALANAAKNEFLESISHEIRNPLNGVVGLTEMLERAPLRPEERELTHSLGACAASLSRVFEDVLSLSKLEYGYVSVEQKPFALVGLLDDVVSLFAVQIRRQRNTLHVAWPSGFADGFLGDEGKLKTIVTNFVGNALKYAPGMAIEIAVSAVPEPAAGEGQCRLGIDVTDHGPGISEEEQKLLFRKFVRGAEAKASGASGTGLGLATCRVLAELLGGKVTVRSARGEGAAFSVQVPLRRAAVPERPARTEAPLAERGERALIVEDQDYNQIILKGLAEKLGYAPDVAARGEAAVALAEERSYAVVFLDWELPGMNGGEVARRLRRHRHTSEAVIIATTAHDNEEIRNLCREAGMDEFALKPYSVAGMRSMLVAARAGRGGGVRPELAGAPGSEAGDAFRLFAAGDPARADEAMSLYLQILDRELAELGHAVDARDLAAIRDTTHRLRSHASLVGDKALNDAARILRERDADASIEELQAAYHRVLVRAEALKSSLLSTKSGA